MDKSSSKGMRLVERDYSIFREVERWRFCLGRHLRVLTGFSGVRACDRRLKILINAGYIERKRILYGVPSVYFLTNKGKHLLCLKSKSEKFRIEQITHDIKVLDTALYILSTYQVATNDIITEKQLNSLNGFGNRHHNPDFIFTKQEETYAIEIELSLKSKDRFENNVKNNYSNYDYQFWIVPKEQNKIVKRLEDFSIQYPNIKIIFLEVINEYIESIK